MQDEKSDSDEQSFKQEKFLVLAVHKLGCIIECVAATVTLSRHNVIIDYCYKREYWVSVIIGQLNVTKGFSFKFLMFSRTLRTCFNLYC